MNEYGMNNHQQIEIAPQPEMSEQPAVKADGIALPRGWSFICPNRIQEQRLAKGYESVASLYRKIKTISYARLVTLETGRVYVRDSEFELIAKHLNLKAEDLRLPPLSQEETLEWAENWTFQMFPEGGDKESVLVAAYTLHCIQNMGLNISSFARRYDFPRIKVADVINTKRMVNDYDEESKAAIKLATGETSYTSVIRKANEAYKKGHINYEIERIRAPRLKFMPEDPDKRAPWTYETDPFRKKLHKRPGTGFHVTHGMVAPHNRGVTLQKRHDHKAEYEKTCYDNYMKIKKEAFINSQIFQLRELFPHDHIETIRKIAEDKQLAATIIVRARLSRRARKPYEVNAAAKLLGIKPVKLRHIQTADQGMLTNFMPKGNYPFERISL
jgi:hypothetical protein